MVDPELKSYLSEINKNLIKLGRPAKRQAFFNGLLSGLGSVIGVAIALTLIGWILNFVGVIPTLRNQVKQWQGILEQSQQYKSSPLNGSNSRK